MGQSRESVRRDARMNATLTAIPGLGGKGPACFLVEAAGARRSAFAPARVCLETPVRL